MRASKKRRIVLGLAGGLFTVLLFSFLSDMFISDPIERSRLSVREAGARWRRSEEYLLVRDFIREIYRISIEKDLPFNDVMRAYFLGDIVIEDKYAKIRDKYIFIDWKIEPEEGENWYTLIPPASLEKENWPAVLREFQLVPFRGGRHILPNVIDARPAEAKASSTVGSSSATGSDESFRSAIEQVAKPVDEMREEAKEAGVPTIEDLQRRAAEQRSLVYILERRHPQVELLREVDGHGYRLIASMNSILAASGGRLPPELGEILRLAIGWAEENIADGEAPWVVDEIRFRIVNFDAMAGYYLVHLSGNGIRDLQVMILQNHTIVEPEWLSYPDWLR